MAQLELYFTQPQTLPRPTARGGRPAPDITGQTLNGCLVLGQAPKVTKESRWRVVAACGHETLIPGVELRRRDRFGYLPYFCEPCRVERHSRMNPRASIVCVKCKKKRWQSEFHKRAGKNVGYRKTCKRCTDAVPRGRVPELIECKRCADMPWRRDEAGCKGCKRPYEAEDMETTRYLGATNRSASKWEAAMPDTNVSTWDVWPNRRPAEVAKRKAASANG